jgi:hypothetical protein
VQGGGGARGIAGEHPITGSEIMLVALPTSFSSWMVVLDTGTASLDTPEGGLTGCILEGLDVIGAANGIELGEVRLHDGPLDCALPDGLLLNSDDPGSSSEDFDCPSPSKLTGFESDPPG